MNADTVGVLPQFTLGWSASSRAFCPQGCPNAAHSLLEAIANADALAKFQKGESGFKDRDLYVFCIGPDGTWSAHPDLKGQRVKDWVTAAGKAPAEEMFNEAKEGKISELSYLFHRPGATKHEDVPKVTYFTKVGGQVCGVGYLP